MQINRPRISLLILSILALSVVTPAELTAVEKRKPRQPYRVIFNCDGHAVAKDADGDLQQWLENLFGPLQESHVDALFWCDGAGGNTANYDSKVLERTGARTGTPRTYIDKWIEEGHDPPRVVVEEARKRGIDIFYSFRINDIHDSFIPDEMPTYKVENPDWLIGEKQYGGVTSFKTALNFAIPEVRELKYRVIVELFEKYDFDGLEIDFLRSAPYFLPGHESENAVLLTELLQRVRRHLNARGKQRGRPIQLAVRVNESLVSCQKDGYDVATWIKQGLVDIVTLGSGVMDIEIEEFRQLAGRRKVHVYPCLYGWPSKYSPIPAELATGLALNYWQQGADGIYLFNWFPHTRNNSEATGPYMATLLKQLGSPDTLRAGQSYWMFAADRGRPQRAYQYNWLHCVLPAALPSGKGLQATIRVGEQLPDDAQITMQMLVENLQPNDVLAVTLNGVSIEYLVEDKPGRLVAAVEPGILKPGHNQAVLKMKSRSDASDQPRTITALELHVRLRKRK
jgi:hypothetical protein